ncbi:2OG-Fe(II) oxygenase [Kiloniella antarctica]|uniref:2OG-Fe(II) oxygenase n=1 Tax=Kiloniella antarctica TaxID=1550907 RepID=A0ABW5BL68_9PROT
MALADIIDLDRYPLTDLDFQGRCRQTVDETGVLVLDNFLSAYAVALVQKEGEDHKEQAYFCTQEHNVYLAPSDPQYSEEHPRNQKVISSKGCITDDLIPMNSPLRVLYDAENFRSFLCTVLGEEALHNYADPLSSINLHYAKPGQELGWHFDNSSFATTLMIQEPEAGGAFEYVEKLRDADQNEMNFEGVGNVLKGDVPVKSLSMGAGALVLFRGRNAIHRVAPVEGTRTRMLVVLAYNSKPDIALSESARMTFYGRLG